MKVPVAPGTLTFDHGTSWVGGKSHACNCIGCCQACGQCRTAPWHAATCEKIAFLNLERARIIREA